MVGSALVAAGLAAPSLVATAAIYLAARGRRGEAGTEPLPWRGAAWAFLHEWVATLAFLIATVLPARTTAAVHRSRRVALVVPELYGSTAAFWYLRRRLRAAGWDTATAVRRIATARTAELFAALDARIAELAPDCELILIGHGVGGLLAHRYAQQRPLRRLRHVVTLATPHQGSDALPYRLLARGELTQAEPPSPAAAPDVIAIYSDFDAWLVPVDDAYCPGGFNIAVRGIGHCAVLLSRRVADLLVENLSAPAPDRHLTGA